MTESADELNQICFLLKKNLAILKLVNSNKIQESKEKILKNETKRKIYELCDGTKKVSDVADEIGTSQPNVSYHLSSLLESGLLIFKDFGGQRYYLKTLE